MPIVVIGLSHRTCPVELRERFAFPEPKIPEAIQKLRAEGVAEEAVILSTCNRVEIYAASESASREARQPFGKCSFIFATNSVWVMPIS